MAGNIRITLKAARVNAGYTQEQVCASIGCTKATLVNWEAGNTSPTVDKAIELAELYKLPLESIDFCRKSSM